jgi:hypothetical protein
LQSWRRHGSACDAPASFLRFTPAAVLSETFLRKDLKSYWRGGQRLECLWASLWRCGAIARLGGFKRELKIYYGYGFVPASKKLCVINIVG